MTAPALTAALEETDAALGRLADTLVPAAATALCTSRTATAAGRPPSWSATSTRSVLAWTATLSRVAHDPELSFVLREEVGHDLKGYPPPTVEIALQHLASARRTLATVVPGRPADVLARELTIPDLGTLTVEAWTPPILGHAAGHAQQALDVLRGPRSDRVKAAVLVGLEQVELQERPEPEARPGWVVVQVEAASLCGTDAHQYDGRIDTPFPRVPGHDFSGRVVTLGDGVDPTWQDAPVAVKPSLPCGDCLECAQDKPFDCQTQETHRSVVRRLPHRAHRGPGGQPHPAARRASRRGRRRCSSRSPSG